MATQTVETSGGITRITFTDNSGFSAVEILDTQDVEQLVRKLILALGAQRHPVFTAPHYTGVIYNGMSWMIDPVDAGELQQRAESEAAQETYFNKQFPPTKA